MTCNLATSGPRTGALEPSSGANAGNMAYKPILEVCDVPARGTCLNMNGDECCIGTHSYENVVTNACSGGNCGNWWSGISAERPLSDLWQSIQIALPQI